MPLLGLDLVAVGKCCPVNVVGLRRRSESMDHDHVKEHGVEILGWKGNSSTSLLSLPLLAEGGWIDLFLLNAPTFYYYCCIEWTM